MNVSVPPSAGAEPIEPLPLSLLNDFLFCPRRAGLKIVEGLRRANAHTLIGDLAHEHADLPGYEIGKGSDAAAGAPGLVGAAGAEREVRHRGAAPRRGARRR